MKPKEWINSKQGKIVITVSVVAILVLAGLFYIITKPAESRKIGYSPEVELPAEYGIIMEAPSDDDSMMFSAMLSSLVVEQDGTYHPFFILEEGGNLDDHQMNTIGEAGLGNMPYLLFTKNPDSGFPVASQVDLMGTYDMGPESLARFAGFDGILTVEDHEEALWASTVANVKNLVMVKGPRTYESQEETWKELRRLNVPFDYVMIVNPLDRTTETLHASDGYNTSDDQFHIPALSCVAGEVAAYRSAYVVTQYTSSTDPIADMNLELNKRATGYYQVLKTAADNYGIPSYVTLIGSASAVPQFQLPDQTNADPENVEGDQLVNSDVMYGFLSGDPYYMDSAVGRLVNWNVQGMSNQIVRTYLFDRFESTRDIDYLRGVENIQWRSHGTSFSGYEITYERGQVTPARFWCRDAEDEGMTYDYFGPSGLGRDILFGDGVEPAAPSDMNPALEASGFVAYRGHGSEYGSLYMIPYVINQNEDGVLRAEEMRELFFPPQVGFFVACMNTKIHGAGWWKPAEPMDVERAFALNYLYGGGVVTGGATEVSFSNIAQDATTATEEWLPGIINPSWSDGNYEWDLNDAWFAFFWDGLLDNEETYGTVGEALRWAENRYISNPIRSEKVSPFIQDLDNPDWQGGLMGAHWKEVAMFCIYGDPAFSPEPNSPGSNSYRPWMNGPEDTGEP